MCKVINNVCFINVYITFLYDALKTLNANRKFHKLLLFVLEAKIYKKTDFSVMNHRVFPLPLTKCEQSCV